MQFSDRFAPLLLALLAFVSCTSNEATSLRCGEGTHENSGQCVPSDAGMIVPRFDAAPSTPGEDAAKRECPEGSSEMSGQCVRVIHDAPPDTGTPITCGEGTIEKDGECVQVACSKHDDCSPEELCEDHHCQSLGECQHDSDCGKSERACLYGRCRVTCPSGANACAALHSGWSCLGRACVPAGGQPGASCSAADSCRAIGDAAVRCQAGICRADCTQAGDALCSGLGDDSTCAPNGSVSLCMPRGSVLGGACAHAQCGADLQGRSLVCAHDRCTLACSDTNNWPGYGDALCRSIASDWACSAADSFTCQPVPAANLGRIAAENARPGSADWPLTNPATLREIEGYADSTSVNLGESIGLYVSTAASGYNIDVFRLGYYGGAGARRVAGPVHRAGTLQTTPQPDAEGMVECDWTDPYSLAISSDWLSGIYLARLTADQSGKQSFIEFVVRDDARSADYVFQSSVTTHQAYNNWGGKSLYDFNSTDVQRAHKVSFNRPYGLGLNVTDSALGLGAGEVLTNIQDISTVRATAWEYPMLRFLEREGYDVVYITNLDTHAGRALGTKYKAFLSVGHDEYWTWDMRNNVEYARDLYGTHLAFFGGNDCYWQVRLENDQHGHSLRTLVGYKDDFVNAPLDPVYGTPDAYRLTTRWASLPLVDSEVGLVGVHYQEAGVNDDMVVDDESSWVLAGTGLRRGDRLPGLLGYEVDAMPGAVPAGVSRIMHSPWATASTMGMADMVSYRVPSGSYTFAAGSIQWSWGLDDFGQSSWPSRVTHAAAQQMTRNVLARFLTPLLKDSAQAPLSDDFAANSRDVQRWNFGVITEGAGAFDPNVSVAQQSGRLVIAPRTRLEGLHHNGYVSARTWDMTNGAVSVELAQVLNAASDGDTTFALAIDATHWVRFTQESQSLLMQSMDGTRSSQSVAYDPVQQRVLRLRHAPQTNEFVWEASPDGVQFTQLRRAANTLPVAAMYIELEAGTFQSAVSLGSAQFDNLRFTHTGFADTFDDYRKPEHWTPGTPSGATFSNAGAVPPVQNGGAVRVQPPAASGDARGAGYVSTRVWDLRGGEAVLEVSAVTAGAAATVFSLQSDADHWIRLRALNGQLSCEDDVGGTKSELSTAYDAIAQRYWKLAHHTGDDSVSCETSPDGVTWTVLRTRSTTFVWSGVQAAFGVISQVAGAAPGEAKFESFRLKTALAP